MRPRSGRTGAQVAGHTVRKRFGQNFLTDSGIINKIIVAIAPQASDTLIEIGPGLGALTTPLLATLQHLVAIEIDRDLAARLRQRYASTHLSLITDDVLTVNFAALCAQQQSTALRIVGNLPYNISTPLLFHLAQYAAHLHDLHFMLQKEVVQRMAALPGSRDYGRLSVMLQYRFEIDALFDVPAEAFTPAPKVCSAIVRLRPKPVSALTAQCEIALAKVTTAAFSQRRKMLRNTLSGLFDAATLAKLNIDESARAEQLSLNDFIRLANTWYALQNA